MAKLNMERVDIFAPRSQQKELLRELQAMAVFDVSATAETPPEGFYRESSNPEESRALALLADNAIGIINRISPEKKGLLASFSGRRKVTLDEFFAAGDKLDEVKTVCETVCGLERKIAEAKAEAVRLTAAAEQFAPWEELDLPLSFKGTEKTTAFIGSVSGTLTLEQLLTSLAEVRPEVEFYAEIVGRASGQTFIFTTVSKDKETEAAEALRTIGFSHPSITCEVTPKEKREELTRDLKVIEDDVAEAKRQIAELADRRRELELFGDWHRSAAERRELLSKIDNTSHVIHVTGYVPSEDFPALSERLTERFTVHIENVAAEGDEAPVKLKNNAFVQPAESITSMYSLPSSADVDPTPITSFFYYLFFGLMLSDAGYGILMWIATWAVNRFLDPESNMRRNMKLFMYCGISTTLWGIFFGSFFGVDIVTPIYTAITGSPLPFKYPFMNPMKDDAVAMLLMSLALGLVQTLAGLAVKFWITLKSDGFIDAFLDTGLWMTTLLGFAVMAVGMAGFPVLQTVGLIIAFASMAGIAVFGGRKKKGIMKIFGGVANLYDITGFVSDLLSFSRLMALGLTTAAMSMVFNKLGLMVGGGVIGTVFMVIILLIGHAVNFGLNALGAYVHTLRLQYVELFSKFYDGGGRPFVPFAFKGKYIRIKEEK